MIVFPTLGYSPGESLDKSPATLCRDTIPRETDYPMRDRSYRSGSRDGQEHFAEGRLERGLQRDVDFENRWPEVLGSLVEHVFIVRMVQARRAGNSLRQPA
jgi:hypothetical protein